MLCVLLLVMVSLFPLYSRGGVSWRRYYYSYVVYIYVAIHLGKVTCPPISEKHLERQGEYDTNACKRSRVTKDKLHSGRARPIHCLVVLIYLAKTSCLDLVPRTTEVTPCASNATELLRPAYN